MRKHHTVCYIGTSFITKENKKKIIINAQSSLINGNNLQRNSPKKQKNLLLKSKS